MGGRAFAFHGNRFGFRNRFAFAHRPFFRPGFAFRRFAFARQFFFRPRFAFAAATPFAFGSAGWGRVWTPWGWRCRC
jgi:hypothetical protein